MKKQAYKQLAYYPIDVPSVIVEKEIQNKINILFDGKQVSDLTYLIIRMWNSGNQSIQADDNDSPIEFSFGEKAQILAVEAWGQPSTDLFFDWSSETLSLVPILPNLKSSISIKMWLSGYKSVIIRKEGFSKGEIVRKLSEYEAYQARNRISSYFFILGPC